MENNQFQSQSISTLAKALIQVQKALQPAVKDSTNPFAKSKYASLNSVMEVCREPLIQSGIWLCQYPVPVSEGYLGLATKLTHAESGEWQSSLAVLPLPKADPQGTGSAMTYARRYALSAMLGIVTEDDDGAKASLTPENEEQSKQSQTGASSAYPKLDGIDYEEQVDTNGQVLIIAKGNTLAKKSVLSANGFKWNADKKFWYKAA